MRFPGFEGEWETKKLGDLCKMQSGKFVSASEIFERQIDGLYACYGGNGLRGYTKSFNKDGIYSLIGRQGALCGNVNLVNGKFHATEHAVVATPNDDIDTIWMFYLLTNLNLNQYSTGMAQPGLSVQNLEKINTVFPKAKIEQQKIATFLSLIDRRIITQNKIIEELKVLKVTLSKKIFSQELRFKDENGNNYPEWEVKSLNKICYINPKTKSIPNTFYYIDLESVVDGRLLKEEQILKDSAPSRAQRVLEKKDVLFQMVRPYQKNNLFFDKEGDYVASTGYAQIRTEQDPQFIFQYLHYQTFVDKVIERCTGTSYPAISSNDLGSIEIDYPILPEQTKIANFLSSVDSKIDAESQLLKRLEEQKKFLLQQMFV